MAVLTWGKPKVEIAPYVAGVLPATPTWAELPEIKENTAKLTTAKGTKQEAKGEGGELIDARYNKNAYSFECDIFQKRGDSKPIEDADGLIIPNYAWRLTPEDSTLQGHQMDKTSVSVEESWTSADGTMWKYTFEGLKPATGNILKPYTEA